LEQVDKRAFDAICTLILKRTISADVRQTSAEGRDGGRDAVLNGHCTTGRYDGPSFWIFQYKQYRTDMREARSQAYRDFRKEAADVLRSNPGCDAYLFLTATPFSGLPETGLFDRIQEAKRELGQQFGKVVDFWDGLELCSAIDSAAPTFAHFFEIGRSAAGGSELTESRDQLPDASMLAENLILSGRSLDEEIVEWLYPVGGVLLGPDGTSPLWPFIARGEYFRLQTILRRLAIRLAQRELGSRALAQHGRLWTALLQALVDTKIGKPRRAITRLSLVERQKHSSSRLELRAWANNIASVSWGKLGRETKAQAHAERAVTIAEGNGLHWLASSVQLRMLHRRSWHAWEAGGTFDEGLFQEMLHAALDTKRFCAAPARAHLEAVGAAAQALHYSWSDDTAASAKAHCERALLILHGHPDHDERARMVSELGRISLFRFHDSEGAIKSLRSAALLRARAGDLARLRYDLSWISEAYSNVENVAFAELCVDAALRTHAKLYGSTPTDQDLVKNLLAQRRSFRINKASPGAPDSQMIERLGAATSIDPAWWWSILRRP